MTCTQPGAELQLKESCGILVWTFAILMHPEAILESPFEVACFQFSPVTPGLVAGGCETGQIVIWNCNEVGLHDSLNQRVGLADKLRVFKCLCPEAAYHGPQRLLTFLRDRPMIVRSREG